MSTSGTVRLFCAGVAGCFFITTAAFGLSVSTGAAGSNAQAVHAEGFEGQEIRVGLISAANARESHEAFYDKDQFGNPTGSSHTHAYDLTDDDEYEPISHDTSMGGIICSRGGADPDVADETGVAPQVELYSFKVSRPVSIRTTDRTVSSDWVQGALDKAVDEGCDIIATGIQFTGSSANGESLWSLMYDYYAYEYGLFFATAAGNEQANVTIFGDSYNSLTTGGLIQNGVGIYDQVGDESNPGPTIAPDFRRKPEACAPSQSQHVPTNGDTSWGYVGSNNGQTSWAVPHTAGAAALLLDYADESDDTDREHSEVIKAVMVNSTFPNILDENGTNTVYPYDPNLTWNAWRGYGGLDAWRAYQTLQADRITPGSTTGASKGWAYASLPAGQSHSYKVEGFIHERLTATVTWHRRVEWDDDGNGYIESDELTASVANLDLEIYIDNSSETKLSPQVSTYAAHDNLEKWDILLPATDTYEIRVVSQPDSESASYGLAFEVLEPLPGDVHVDYIVDILDVTDLADYWLNTGCDNPGPACYAYNLSPNERIDLSDFAVLAGNWLAHDERYYPSN